MFELTNEEVESLTLQFATSKTGRGGRRYLPMAFTEHGVLQLSNVLSSERAISVGFIIIDAFVKLREMLTDNLELRLLIEKLSKKTENNVKNIELLFQYLDELMDKTPEETERKPIGFRKDKE